MIKEQSRTAIEQGGEKRVNIPEEWISEILKFKDNWEHREAPSVKDRVRIVLGKHRIDISRRDVLDARWANYAPVPTEVIRLDLSADGRAIVDVIENDHALASDTLGLLKDIPFFSDLISRFKLSAERLPEEQLIGISEGQNFEIEQKIAVREWFSRRASEAPRRRLLGLSIIRSESKDVWQGFVQFLNKNESTRYLMTVGAGPCVIVGGSNLKTGEHGLTHIDAVSNSKSLIDSLVARIGEGQYFVLGGDNSSLNQLQQIKKEIEALKIDVITWDCLNTPKSVAIDGETGELFDLITFTSQ